MRFGFFISEGNTVKRKILRVISLFAAFAVLASIAVSAADFGTTASYIVENVESPSHNSIGGEWSVIGVSRGGYTGTKKDAFCNKYESNAKDTLKKSSGNLSSNKSSEYSRMILAFSALGKNPKSVSGYNLYSALGDMSFVTKQGLNGSIFALIALDSKNADSSGDVTRQRLLRKILLSQSTDGGFSMNASADTDIDVTAMALQALAPYKGIPKVKQAIDITLSYMSKKQNADGSYTSYGVKNCESSCQVIIALCSLGISPKSDSRFIKGGVSVYDDMLSYGLADGSFEHKKGGGSNLMATEQALCAMAAYKRFTEKKSALYDMSGYSCRFTDISSSQNRESIVLLNRLGIVNGTSEDKFSPSANVTRAEFCTILVKLCKIPAAKDAGFSDVKKENWFYEYVNSAFSSGIVNGKGNGRFAPNDGITREEAAVMLERAAKKYSADYKAHNESVLGNYLDSDSASSWSRSALAYCIAEKILVPNTRSITPTRKLTREELAQMICGFLLTL